MLKKIAFLALGLTSSVLAAQNGPGQADHAAPAPAAAAPVKAPPMPFGIVGQPGGSGPMPAVAEYLREMPSHGFYRPARLPDGALPIVLWGNGGCRDDSLSAAQFLREVASHGYFVVVAGPPRVERSVGPAAVPAAPPPADRAAQLERRGRDATSPSQILAGLDWAIARNADPKSPLYRHLDPSRIAVMGHSCGGLQAMRISADPRIKATVLFNSGIFPTAVEGDPESALSVAKSELGKLHAPIAYIIGGPGDIAWPQAIDDAMRVTHVPLFFAHSPAGHSGTFWTAPNGGEYGVIARHWLDSQLKGNTAAGAYFKGPECGLCKVVGWTVPRPLW